MKQLLSITLEGSNIHDIPSFYQMINHLFMADESWKISNSLDALDDLLYGGYGTLQHVDHLKIIWKNAQHSRKALGIETTRQYYLDKLESDQPFNKVLFREKLAKLTLGVGPTYFDIVVEIITSHKNIQLILS